MRALVLGGAGAVCNETTRDLAAYSTFDEIVVADYDLPAVESLIAEIGNARSTQLLSSPSQQSMLTAAPLLVSGGTTARVGIVKIQSICDGKA